MNNPSKHSPWVRFKRGAIIVCSYDSWHGGWDFTVDRWGKAERSRYRGLGWLPTWGNLGSGGPYSLGMDSPQTLGEALAQAEAALSRARGRGLVPC